LKDRNEFSLAIPISTSGWEVFISSWVRSIKHTKTFVNPCAFLQSTKRKSRTFSKPLLENRSAKQTMCAVKPSLYISETRSSYNPRMQKVIFTTEQSF